MKEFDKPIPKAEEIEIVAQDQQEKKPAIANVIMHKGHTMFEINCETGEIKEAEYFQSSASFVTSASKKKIRCNPNCLYVPCLNIKNAKKKFARYVMENLKQ